MNETRQHIIETSLILFLQKSYKEVTMNELVKTTGLSKGAFYHYFNSKEELFKEIATIFFSMGITDYTMFNQNSLHQFYTDYINHTALSFKKINEMVGVNDEGTTSLNFFMLMFDAINRFPEFLKIELDNYNHSLQAWINVVDNAKKIGEISTNTNSTEIADLFLYCTDGVFMRYVNSDKKKNYTDQLLNAFNAIYNNLKS